MYPSIFSIVSIDSGVLSVFGSNPVRVFPFGGVPEGMALPYAVWQIVGGSPENYIDTVPDMDSHLIQIDVYAETVTVAASGAGVLRNALEHHAHIVSWRGASRDNATQHFRYSFDINFFTAR